MWVEELSKLIHFYIFYPQTHFFRFYKDKSKQLVLKQFGTAAPHNRYLTNYSTPPTNMQLNQDKRINITCLEEKKDTFVQINCN